MVKVLMTSSSLESRNECRQRTTGSETHKEQESRQRLKVNGQQATSGKNWEPESIGNWEFLVPLNVSCALETTIPRFYATKRRIENYTMVPPVGVPLAFREVFQFELCPYNILIYICEVPDMKDPGSLSLFVLKSYSTLPYSEILIPLFDQPLCS